MQRVLDVVVMVAALRESNPLSPAYEAGVETVSPCRSPVGWIRTTGLRRMKALLLPLSYLGSLHLS